MAQVARIEITPNDLYLVRLQEVSLLAETLSPPDWRVAAHLLWLRWLNVQGTVNLEGVTHGVNPPEGTFTWLYQ